MTHASVRERCPVNSHTLICAIGTPLTEQETLHGDGLELHVHDQWAGAATGILVGGTMGAMQMLADSTYIDLLRHAVQFSRGRGEVMAGIGDTSLARTVQRAEVAAAAKADAVVVLSPYFIPVAQDELVAYFSAVADRSALPVYLYDLPALTRTTLEPETIARLAKHPNIVGIKCSRDVCHIRRLVELDLPNFRVIAAQAECVDILLRHGYRQHLDGVFALAPFRASEIFVAADTGDWDAAARAQATFVTLLTILRRHGVFQTFGAILNARGIPGSFAPAPLRPLDAATHDAVLQEPSVRELAERHPAGASSARPRVHRVSGNAQGNGDGDGNGAASQPDPSRQIPIAGT
jgi:4-hydroxy-tetrahydrodipicolinate synthase